MDALLTGQAVGVDGALVRRSHDRGAGRAPMHVVTARTAGARAVLDQLAVAGDSNEIPAVSAVLEPLDLDGAVAIVAALHSRVATARTMRDRGADCVLPLKDNQRATPDSLESFFDEAFAPPGAESRTGR